MQRFVWVACAATAAVLLAPPARAGSLRAGYAYGDITPDQAKYGNVWMGGYSFFRLSDGVHDPLFARTIAISDGTTIATVTYLDIVGLFNNNVDDIRAKAIAKGAKIPATNMLVGSTHQHSGPDTIGIWGPTPLVSGIKPEYLEDLKETAAQSIVDALGRMVEVEFRFGFTMTRHGMIRDLRIPDEVIDDELAVWQAVGTDGVPVFTLVNWGCHPEIMDEDNHKHTADFPGVWLRLIRERFGGDGLFVPGAVGGLMSPSGDYPTTWEGQEIIAGELIEHTAEALDGAVTVKETAIELKRKVFDIPLMNTSLYLLFVRGSFAPRQLVNGCCVHTEVNYLRIGPAEIITVPGELTPEIGFVLKGAMRGQYKFIFGLNGDELGYILPEKAFLTQCEEYWEGERIQGAVHDCYEESVSVGPKSGTYITGYAKQLITGVPFTPEPLGAEKEEGCSLADGAGRGAGGPWLALLLAASLAVLLRRERTASPRPRGRGLRRAVRARVRRALLPLLLLVPLALAACAEDNDPAWEWSKGYSSLTGDWFFVGFFNDCGGSDPACLLFCHAEIPGQLALAQQGDTVSVRIDVAGENLDATGTLSEGGHLLSIEGEGKMGVVEEFSFGMETEIDPSYTSFAGTWWANAKTATFECSGKGSRHDERYSDFVATRVAR